MSASRVWSLALLAGSLSCLAAAPHLLVELGRFQNRWEGRPADPVVCSFRQRTGAPCLGCGGTHALRLAARGRFVQAFQANPLGAWSGIVLWSAGALAAGSALTGRRPPLWPLVVTLVTSTAVVFLVTLVWWWHRLPAGLRWA